MQKNVRKAIDAINFLLLLHFSHLLRDKCKKFIAFIAIFHIYRFMREIFLICGKCENCEMQVMKNAKKL